MKSPARIKKVNKSIDHIEILLRYYMQNSKDWKETKLHLEGLREFVEKSSMEQKVHDIKLWEKFKSENLK